MTTTWTPASEISPQSQKDRVRDLLRSSGRDGLCSLFGYSIGIPNSRNRVGELRDDDGLEIETIPCDQARYHAGERVPAHVRWIWFWNGNPHQLRLLRAI
jgi:hypothetical protein